jgi:hypothetical protein
MTSRRTRTYLRPDSSKCLHYYFYFLDAELGLVYLRVPTWARLAQGSVRRSRMEWQDEGPFRLQFYCNGHGGLARQLTAAGIGFTAADNAFVRIDDWHRARELADGFSPDLLHRVLDRYAAQCCPVLQVFGQTYHWSLMQVEYATDLVFRSAATLGPLYEQLTRQSVLSVKAEQIATFPGRQITSQLAQELGSQFSTRIEGTCIKHRFGSASIKCTTSSARYFASRPPPTTCPFSSTTGRWNIATARQRVSSPRQEEHLQLIDLREILFGCNRRYLEHLPSTTSPLAFVRSTG